MSSSAAASSSISNPFFAAPSPSKCAAVGAGVVGGGGEEEGPPVLELGPAQLAPEQRRCCVANPFIGSGEFERHMSQSGTSLAADAQCSSAASAGGGGAHFVAAKVLLDSGYRSTTSNSALEEEMAAAAEQRQRHERELRRKGDPKRRTNNASTAPQHRQQQQQMGDCTVPAFLRRTCSTAAAELAATVRSGGSGATQWRTAPPKKAPRRTRSVGLAQPKLLYGTGWMVEAELSSSGDDSAAATPAEKEGCCVEVGDHRRVGIQQLHETLISRFCFISGLTTGAGHRVVTFPDSRTLVSFEQYQLLIDYLLHTQRSESSASGVRANEDGFVLVVDRRMDCWSAVRTLFSYLMSYFPAPVRLVFVLKPERVLQRAIEYGYRGLLEANDKFKVVICQSCAELHEFVAPQSLTMDVGGVLKHNHQEWVAHRMDIERMKSSAGIIAESLSEFGKCLRETELPNDVQTTERILEAQQQERDAIKEDFRISIRKGMTLLRQVRQLEQNPLSEQLAPSRLQNVTAIERMIAQLQDTERSFDVFWLKHRQRLLGCLELRRFEDEFRKLQHCFAKHMLHLDEHKEVGNSETSADRLSKEHEQYRAQVSADVVLPCRALNERGAELSAKGELAELLNCTQGSDSVGPKCEELARMADALQGAIERRGRALELSRRMHAQIGKANGWCRRGVELLSIAPLDLLSAGCSNNAAIYEHAMARLEHFLAEGDALKMDALRTQQTTTTSGSNSPTTAAKKSASPGAGEGLLVLSTTEASSLLAQVSERIDDIKRLSRARHDALKKLSAARSAPCTTDRPVQVVSPERAPAQLRAKDKKKNLSASALLQRQHFSLDNSNALQNGAAQPPCLVDHHHSPARSNSCSVSASPSSCCSAVATPCYCSPSAPAGFGAQMRSLSMENAKEETTSAKASYVLDELLSTEKSYVRELCEILTHYVQPFEALEVSGSAQLAPALRGQADILFGNIRELLDFHQSILLPALQHCADSVHGVCAVLSAQRQRLLPLYRTYCRNKPLSEALRAEHAVDQCKFIAACQHRAGHLLPLSAYLLKPVQRITKYQLLLKELIRHCSDADQSQSVQTALASMLDVLAQINADMEQLHILGYPGDLRLLGALRLRTECEVYCFKRAKSSGALSASGGASSVRRGGPKGKHQRRHLFLFDGGVLFCKKRPQAVHMASEYYEHKLCIPAHSLGFAECSRHQAEDRFDIWDAQDSACYAVQPLDERARPKWVQRLARLTILHQQQREKMAEAAAQEGQPPDQFPAHEMLPHHHHQEPANGAKAARPQSWTTTSSSEDGMGSVLSSRSSASSSATFEEKHTKDRDSCCAADAMSASCPAPESPGNVASGAPRAHSQPPQEQAEQLQQ